MFLQLFFSAATFHSLAVFGHECTFLAVAPDSSHSLSAPAFTNIWYWTLDSNYFMKTCIQVSCTPLLYVNMYYAFENTRRSDLIHCSSIVIWLQNDEEKVKQLTFVDEISVKTMTPIADFIFKIFSCYY